jgi:hypothetical protein
MRIDVVNCILYLFNCRTRFVNYFLTALNRVIKCLLVKLVKLRIIINTLSCINSVYKSRFVGKKIFKSVFKFIKGIDLILSC